ncbi:MAG: replicative DNA helicase [Clostridia bacterium]|nr:replicative DNA helicase [Clostridia bacterium]
MARVPPHSLEAERAVLGAALLSQDAALRMAVELDTADFYDPKHRLIFDSITGLLLEDRPVDALSVIDSLTEAKKLGAAGNASYIVGLADDIPVLGHVAEYIQQVRRASIRRRAIEAATKIAQAAYDSDADLEQVIGLAQEEIFSLGLARDRRGPADIAQSFKARWQYLHETREEPLAGMITTGFADLDDRLGGMAPGDLVVLAARPSMGKTALAFQICLHAARAGKRCLFMSLEMSTNQLMDRLAGLELGINQQRLRLRLLQPEDWQLGFELPRKLQVPLYIDDSSGLSTAEIAGRARLAKKVYGIEFLAIDYLQFINEPRRPGMSTNDLIGQVTRSLKDLAKSLGIPVLLLSQLNRMPESRQDKRPQLADLRGSGNIEQDADQVWLLWRPEFYDPTDRPGIACLSVAKHRNGPTFEVELQFEKHLAKFRDLAREDETA